MLWMVIGARGGGTGKSDMGAEDRELSHVSEFPKEMGSDRGGGSPSVLSLIGITHAVLQQV